MKKSLMLTAAVALWLLSFATGPSVFSMPVAVVNGALSEDILVLLNPTFFQDQRSTTLDSSTSEEIRYVPANLLVETSTLTETLLFLPMVYNRWPPIPDTPLLLGIDNGDGNGSYLVDWDAAYLANTYELQEDDNVAFSSPFDRYNGTATSYNVSGNSTGTYYYRVRACNNYGCSLWSQPPRSVTVLPPSTLLSVRNGTGGNLCYEVRGTGIGEKCFPSGTHFYGSFPSGTYEYRVSARCGSLTKTRFFASGAQVHEFWCGYSSSGSIAFQLADRVE